MRRQSPGASHPVQFGLWRHRWAVCRHVRVPRWRWKSSAPRYLVGKQRTLWERHYGSRYFGEHDSQVAVRAVSRTCRRPRPSHTVAGRRWPTCVREVRAQATAEMPRQDPGEADAEYRYGLSLEFICALTSLRPGHARVSPDRSTAGDRALGENLPGGTPLDRA